MRIGFHLQRLGSNTMSDDTGKQDDPKPATGEEVDPKPTEETLGESGKNAIAELRQRAKAAEEALAEFGGLSKSEVRKFISEAKSNERRLKELDQERMSDLEKAQTVAKEYEEAAAKASTEALRWRIAARFGIADDDAETFLTATDEDALTRQAERLQALAAPSGTPLPDPTQGAKGDKPKPDAAQQFAQAFSGRL